MKKAYSAPQLELQIYNLSASIASNCHVVVKNGPAIEELGITECSDYAELNPFPSTSSYSLRQYNVNFYNQDVCDCYTSAGNGEYWTS